MDSSRWFILIALILLLVGQVFGLVGALQYILPGFLKETLSFERVRPLHVSSEIFWIIMAASGSVMAYTREFVSGEAYPRPSAIVQLILFSGAIVLILGSYAIGVFGGREYWEYPPLISILIVVAWLVFVINHLRTVQSLRGQPVFTWMWLTGVVGFLLTFLESYLWLIPYFREDIVRDMMIQWKSYGSMVGCWNMMVYGSGIYLMEKIQPARRYAYSRTAYLLFFLGLFNLLFNWSHHIYTLPVAPYIRHVGYLVSMTELLILGRMIYNWKESLSALQRSSHALSYRFLLLADGWVFANLVLAILISIPSINLHTHGTHITVTHVMGTTIGINTMILLAITFDLLGSSVESDPVSRRRVLTGSWLITSGLLVFLVSWFLAGVHRSQWQMSSPGVSFSEMMLSMRPYFAIVALSGSVLFVGFCLVVYPLIAHAFRRVS